MGEGEARESYEYDEFGQALFPYEEKKKQSFGYTGYQMEEGGLYFAQARWYEPGREGLSAGTGTGTCGSAIRVL